MWAEGFLPVHLEAPVYRDYSGRGRLARAKPTQRRVTAANPTGHGPDSSLRVMPFPRQRRFTAGENLDNRVVILCFDISPGGKIFKEEFWNKGTSDMQMKLDLVLFWIVLRSKFRHEPSASQTWFFLGPS